MISTEPALVDQRVADLHRDAQASRLAAAARSARPHRSAELHRTARAGAARVSTWVRSLRPATVEGQVCCA